jgi:hypothetical protein
LKWQLRLFSFRDLEFPEFWRSKQHLKWQLRLFSFRDWDFPEFWRSKQHLKWQLKLFSFRDWEFPVFWRSKQHLKWQLRMFSFRDLEIDARWSSSSRKTLNLYLRMSLYWTIERERKRWIASTLKRSQRFECQTDVTTIMNII